MNFLSALVRFENLHEVRRLCHWGPIIALSVIAICSTMAIIDSVIWYWPLDTTAGSINFLMLLNWTVLILYNYFNAMFVGPGYIPLGWKPENPKDTQFLQYCSICQGYKAPRSHHCRKCNRCVMKMDHHCPWINNCCGHLNHAYFTSFLLLAPLGCSHAAFIFVMTMYTQLYERISFGWSTVKIDMSAVRQFQPLMPFSVPAFAATLFALGLALGTTIAVGMLFFIQMKVILRNKTSIESWIEEKAKDRIQHYQTGEEFVFPYDLGSRWLNFKHVFTLSGTPRGNGLEWPVHSKCHQYTLTIEQLKQKADKRVRSQVQYQAVEDYNGACCPLNKGFRTFFRTPCTEEPRIPLRVFGAALLNEEKTAAVKPVATPCWLMEEFVVVEECVPCSDFHSKTQFACKQTGYVERINCTKSSREDYKSCRSASMEEHLFWKFEAATMALTAFFAALVVVRQRQLDRRASEKVRRQIESI